MNCNMTDSAAILISLIFAVSVCSTVGDSLGRGLGDDFEWRTLQQGLQEASDLNKPIMLIIHKSWCGACKNFKPKFASSDKIKELSNRFVMVNLEDNDDPGEDKYKPDGGYVPRVLFMDSKGSVLTDIFNREGNANYKYFYSDMNSLIVSMNSVMELGSRPRNDDL